MREIVFPEDVRKMLWIIIGEMPLQARENLAYYSKELYLTFRRALRYLRDEMQRSIADASTSLPDDVGDAYVRGLSLLVDDGGVNHLDEMLDQLDEIAQGQVDHSIKIQAAKWEIIAEIVMLLIELALLAALAAITGGTSISQMALAKARSRLAVFIIVQRLVQLAPFTAVLTEAFEEALQSLAVQLAQMALNPDDRKPDSIDWRDVGKSAAAGALTGLFQSIFHGGGKWLKNWMKNFDSFDKFAKKHPNWTKGLNGGAGLTGVFVSSAVSESVAEYLVQGAFEGEWDFKWETLVGAGTSSVITVIAGDALAQGGLKVHKFATTTGFNGINDSSTPPGDSGSSGNSGGKTSTLPTTSAAPVTVTVPSPIPTVTTEIPTKTPATPIATPVPAPVTAVNVPTTPVPTHTSLPFSTSLDTTVDNFDSASDVSSLDNESLFDSDTASIASDTTYASTSSHVPLGTDPAAVSSPATAKGFGNSGSRTGFDDATDWSVDDTVADLGGTEGSLNPAASPAGTSTPDTHTPRTGTGTGTGAAANSPATGQRTAPGGSDHTDVQTADTSGDLLGEDADDSTPQSSTGHTADTDTTLPRGTGTASGAQGGDERRTFVPDQETSPEQSDDEAVDVLPTAPLATSGATPGAHSPAHLAEPGKGVQGSGLPEQRTTSETQDKESGQDTGAPLETGTQPAATVHTVPTAPAALTGNPGFEAARAAATPVTRTHTWVDPVSTPADTARPGRWGAEPRAPRLPQATDTTTETTVAENVAGNAADTETTPALAPAAPLTTVSGSVSKSLPVAPAAQSADAESGPDLTGTAATSSGSPSSSATTWTESAADGETAVQPTPAPEPESWDAVGKASKARTDADQSYWKKRHTVRWMASQLVDRKLAAAGGGAHGEPFGVDVFEDGGTAGGVVSDAAVSVPVAVEPANADALVADLSVLSALELLDAVALLPV
ncbi:hypothetical protein, partial [Streptomyces sp. NPDC127084]|uniref:WXG100-like domain-containing protein n=1 Tax=Streptomyces sp. NPDC127084 TaxID=3347133 RepID=UPI0036632F69